MLRLWQGPLKAPFLLHGEHASLTTLGRRGDGVDLGILVPVHRRPKVNTQANARAHTSHVYNMLCMCGPAGCTALYWICCRGGLGAWSGLRFVRRLPCFSSWSLSLTSPSPSLQRPLQILLARALQRGRIVHSMQAACSCHTRLCRRHRQTGSSNRKARSTLQSRWC